MSEGLIPQRLLAKSRRPGKPEVTLEAHLIDTEKAARRVFGSNRRWREKWCEFFGIVGLERQERFLVNLYVASLFHDIGKANEDFYLAVSGPGFRLQALRHEHISG